MVWIDSTGSKLIATERGEGSKIQGLEAVDDKMRAGQRGCVVSVRNGDRFQARGPRRLQSPQGIFDRDAFTGVEIGAGSGRQERNGAQIRIGRRFADERVLRGDDRA